MKPFLSQFAILFLLTTLSFASQKFEKLIGIAEIKGVTYECWVDAEKVRKGPKWDFGDDEPPLGPNKAMKIAAKAVAKFFPDVSGMSSNTISLIRFKEGAVYQAIFDDDPKRAIGDRSILKNYIYVYVYLDGSVVVPKRAPKDRQIIRPKAKK